MTKIVTAQRSNLEMSAISAAAAQPRSFVPLFHVDNADVEGVGASQLFIAIKGEKCTQQQKAVEDCSTIHKYRVYTAADRVMDVVAETAAAAVAAVERDSGEMVVAVKCWSQLND